VKRGGQHPEWDEEVRFTLYEDVEDLLAKTSNDADTPPPPPPKTITLPERVKGGKGMLVSCYADDPREPDYIGECTVDLTEVLTKGETDGQSFVSSCIATLTQRVLQNGSPYKTRTSTVAKFTSN
jgi:hypothetical protein